MLCVAVAGMDEQLVSMLFGLTMFRFRHAVNAVKRFKWLRRRVPLIQVDLIGPVLTVAALMANFTYKLLLKRKFERYIPLICTT